MFRPSLDTGAYKSIGKIMYDTIKFMSGTEI